MRTIQFDQSTSMGQLRLRRRSAQIPSEEPWRDFQEAQGSVTIPDGDDLAIVVRRGGKRTSASIDIEPQRLDFLNDLPRDTFEGLHVSGVDPVTVGSLAGHASLEQLSMILSLLHGEHLTFLDTLPALYSLELPLTHIGDAGLAHISRQQQLRVLNLREVQGITDVGIGSLGTLVNLQALGLAGTAITGANLSSLAKLRQLRQLYLGGTRLSDDALPQIAALHAIALLDLSYTNVRGDRLSDLAAISGLTELRLSGLRLTRRAIESLEAFALLETLTLEDNSFTVDDLLALRLPAALKTLKLGRLHSEAQVVDELRARHPRCTITYYDTRTDCPA